MKYTMKIIFAVFLLLTGVCLGGTAGATLMADITYLETKINGTWQYDYTFTNATDAADSDALDLFEVHLFLSEPQSFENIVVPDGWEGELIAPAGNSYILTVSIPIGIPADILPGESLSGFKILFNQQVGNLPYLAYFWDPDQNDPPYVEGTTAPVPEPATILLVTSGMLGLGILRRKNKQQTQTFST